MPETVGIFKADLLLRLRGSEELYDVAVVELPLRSELEDDGRMRVWLDASALAELGPALAEEMTQAFGNA